MVQQSEEQQLAWLSRRIGMGPVDGFPEVDPRFPAAAIVDAWLDPDAFGLPDLDSPFTTVAPTFVPERRLPAGIEFIGEWFDFLHDTPRPLEAFMTMFWHDHFAVSYAVVNRLGMFAQHLEVLRSNALGNFRDLLYAVAIDPAMLEFLNGKQSTFRVPNENFGRELLELYSIGVGNFTEADVQAAARAATGWQIVPATGQSRLVPARHEQAAQTVVGVSGVDDMASLVDAVVQHEACAPFITRKLCAWILGGIPGDDVVAGLAASFVDADYELRPLLRSIIGLGLDGQTLTQPLGPVFWFTAARRATGSRPPGRVTVPFLEAAGMTPGLPPNVGGFPAPSAYLSASSVAARFSAASLIVEGIAGDARALTLATELELDELARHLGLLDGFVPATRSALLAVHRESPRRKGHATLALALASPEVAVV